MGEQIRALIKEQNYFSADDDLKRIQLVQELLAARFPFENLDVLLKVETPITPRFIEEKMLQHGRGGLCYELNALQHLILRELGYNVFLSSATVSSGNGWAEDRTHVLNLLYREEKLYAIDSGFGSNLPLHPIELDGPFVTSSAGSFRLCTLKTEKGTIAFQSKNEQGWETRYAFYPEKVEWKDLNRIKKEIHNSARSLFNRELLMARLLPESTLSVNEDRLQIKGGKNGNQKLHFSTYDEMLESIKVNFPESIYQAAVQYVHTKREGMENA